MNQRQRQRQMQPLYIVRQDNWYVAAKTKSLQKLFHPAIPDGKTRSKFGEHGNYGKISTRWIKSHQKTSEGEKQAFFCWYLNKDIHCMFVEGKPRTVFFLQTLYFAAYIAAVEKIILKGLKKHDPGSAQMTSAALVTRFSAFVDASTEIELKERLGAFKGFFWTCCRIRALWRSKSFSWDAILEGVHCFSLSHCSQPL